MKFASSHDSTIFPFHLVLAKIVEKKLEMRKWKALPRIRTNVGKHSCSCRWDRTYKGSKDSSESSDIRCILVNCPRTCFLLVFHMFLMLFCLNLVSISHSPEIQIVCDRRTDGQTNPPLRCEIASKNCGKIPHC